MKIPAKGKQLAVLSETIGLISQSREEDERVRAVFRAFERLGLTASARFRLAQVNRDRTMLVLTHASGEYQGIAIHGLAYNIGSAKSLTGWVVDHAKPVTVASIEKDSRLTPTWKGKWDQALYRHARQLQSFMAIPIKAGDTVIGVLSLDSTTKNFFDQAAVDMIQPYAHLLGAALGSAPPSDAEKLISSVNNYRKQQVLILGKDTPPEVQVLETIASVLAKLQYKPLLVKDHPDIPEVSNEEKVRILADLSRFVVLENSYPAGQIVECKICATNRIITAAVRKEGCGSSYMVTDYFKDFDFMKEFTYGTADAELPQAVERGATWAESKTAERRDYYDKLYPWRRKADSDAGKP
jgi:hypothetical protein